jgi:hypothetical protein
VGLRRKTGVDEWIIFPSKSTLDALCGDCSIYHDKIKIHNRNINIYYKMSINIKSHKDGTIRSMKTIEKRE